MADTKDVKLEAMVEELAKLIAATPRDTKAALAKMKEIDQHQRDAEKAEAAKAQVAIEALNSHLTDVLQKSFKQIVEEGGIQKLHGEKAVVRMTIALDPPNGPSYNAVVGGAATPRAPKASGGGNGGAKGWISPTGADVSLDTAFQAIATGAQKTAHDTAKDGNAKYAIKRSAVKAAGYNQHS